MLVVSLWGELFVQGSKNFGVTIGAGSGYNSSYTIVGINASYFIVDNLLAGLEYRGWFGGEPSINELSVPVTYILPLHQKFRPYAGAFYRRTFIESPYDDYNIYGARGGVSMILDSSSYASFGWVQEWFDPSSDGDTSRGYPEIAVGVSF